MSDELKVHATRFLTEHNQPPYMNSLDELCTTDCFYHKYFPGMPNAMDRGDYNGFIAAFRACLPDIGNTLEDIVVSADRLAMRWGGHCTHTGEPLMGLPAKANSLSAHGIYLLRFEGTRIAEVWNNWDNANVMTQPRA